jgi:cyclic beta-1,2-glucan synthetase
VRTTGDIGMLEENTPYVTAPTLDPGEDERFLRPEPATERATVYEHAARAIERSLAVGVHGLPLFGSGDWNDGMNRVGREGRGESVWMGGSSTRSSATGPISPRAVTTRARAEVARASRIAPGGARARGMGRRVVSARLVRQRRAARLARERRVPHRRARPGVVRALRGRVARARDQAMASLETFLISEPDRLIRLLTPPFRDTTEDPGYIKGYVAGVRENGGQYTHAALWVVRAYAELGRRDRPRLSSAC